jgi:arylsulfatase A-like enzyme
LSRPFRYTFILILVAVGTCLAAVSGWRYARASAPINGPIVMISIDSLRPDHLASYGYKGGRTPAIDLLATDGIVFEHAYSQVPQTLPAHAALLTGRLPFENGVRDSVGFTLNANERLLGEMLRDRGYKTAGIVSSYLLRKESGIDQGFEFFDAELPAATGGGTALRRDGIDTERVAERWLDSAGTSRAFLFLHLANPDGSAITPAQQDTLSSYDRGIAQADDAVGRLIRYLKSHQLYDQSTIILLSDHGEGIGDHGEQTHGLFVYDDALHVPLVIKQAAGQGAGLRVKTFVQQIDIVPTVLDLAKAPVPGNLRGRSLSPLFERGGTMSPRTIYAESLYGRYHFGWSALTSVTDGRYRYIDAPSPELFDLLQDPAERSNVITAHPDIVATLRKELAALVPAGPPAAPAPVSASDRARFEALGYVGSGDDSSQVIGSIADPKDKVGTLEAYRTAVTLLSTGHVDEALEAFRALGRTEPELVDAWTHVAETATRAERHDVAADAYRHVIALRPTRPEGYLGAATTALRQRKLDDARLLAQTVLDDDLGANDARAEAHELLARIALGRRNLDLARAEAALAEKADAVRPVVAYINGRIAFDQKRYPAALDLFEEALETIAMHHDRPLADLQLYAAESLSRNERWPEAEYLFLEQLKDTPRAPRALAGLESVYRATGRTDEAAVLAQH